MVQIKPETEIKNSMDDKAASESQNLQKVESKDPASKVPERGVRFLLALVFVAPVTLLFTFFALLVLMLLETFNGRTMDGYSAGYFSFYSNVGLAPLVLIFLYKANSSFVKKTILVVALLCLNIVVIWDFFS